MLPFHRKHQTWKFHHQLKNDVVKYILYFVGIRWVHSAPKIAEMEPIFDLLGEWVRFTADIWIVTTDRTPNQMREALRTLLHTDDSILIMARDQRCRSGWIPKWMIDWLEKQPVHYTPNPLVPFAPE
jgi:hypothetical protein